MKLTKEGLAVIEGDNYLSADIIAQGRLDVAREWLEQYHKYIPQGGVVVDVGACLGDMTATFSEFVGPKGWVHAFEPNPMVMDCLCYNVARRENVLLYDFALGASKGQANIIVDHNNIGASYLLRINSGTVEVRPLDDIARGWDRLDFIKIDAEGYEPLVLAGAKMTLRRLRPVLLVEIDQRALGFQRFKPSNVHEWLDELDYDFTRFDGAHGDILCVPKERAGVAA
jgi:FkbM family methyltransferase